MMNASGHCRYISFVWHQQYPAKRQKTTGYARGFELSESVSSISGTKGRKITAKPPNMSPLFSEFGGLML
jgi:hypothetical protein